MERFHFYAPSPTRCLVDVKIKAPSLMLEIQYDYGPSHASPHQSSSSHRTHHHTDNNVNDDTGRRSPQHPTTSTSGDPIPHPQPHHRHKTHHHRKTDGTGGTGGGGGRVESVTLRMRDIGVDVVKRLCDRNVVVTVGSLALEGDPPTAPW